MIIKHDDKPKKAKKKSSKKKAAKKVAKKLTEHIAPFPKQKGPVIKGDTSHNRSKFNSDTTDALIACGAQGAYRQDVCTKVGISATTLANWLDFGKRRQDEIDDWNRKSDVAAHEGKAMTTICPEECQWTQFRVSFLRAELQAKEEAEEFVKKHRNYHWQASAWWLERRYALEYGSAAGRVGIGEHAKHDDSDTQESDPETELLDAINAWEDAATTKRDS